LVLNIFIDDNHKKIGKLTKQKYLYLTKEKLPIVLVKVSELVKIFSLNNLELESLQKGLVTVSTGERNIIKATLKKINFYLITTLLFLRNFYPKHPTYLLLDILPMFYCFLLI